MKNLISIEALVETMTNARKYAYIDRSAKVFLEHSQKISVRRVENIEIILDEDFKYALMYLTCVDYLFNYKVKYGEADSEAAYIYLKMFAHAFKNLVEIDYFDCDFFLHDN